jgi:hypothetical protein
MSDVQQADSSERGDQPGKMRTMWHPLLVQLLACTLDSAFKVEQEVSVGKMPLRVDILLIRREGGQLSEDKARDVAELLPLLNRFTLIEFKSPVDAMQPGDFAQLVGCSYLWHSQQSERFSREEISLIIVAPVVNGSLREELRLLGCEIAKHEPGIFRITGLPFTTWFVETDAMAERGQLVLSFVSREFLNDPESIIERLAHEGKAAMLRCHYMVQNVKQFHEWEKLSMQQAVTETLERFDERLLEKLLEELPAEKRLRGLSPEEVLRVFPPEQFLAGLSNDERARFFELLERQRKQDR